METLKSLGERLNRPIVEKVMNKFGNLLVENIIINNNMSDGEIFMRLVSGHGKQKPHSLRNYVRREGKMKNS